MRREFRNTFIAIALSIWGSYHFFYKAAHNTTGLIINHLFQLNASQANTFYFIMGCLCILVLAACGASVYLLYKQGQ